MYRNQFLSGRFCFLLLFKKFMLVRLAIFLSNLQKELKDISVRGGIGDGGDRERLHFLGLVLLMLWDVCNYIV